jgi:hypothetical protein
MSKARYRLEHSGEPNSVTSHGFASVNDVTVTVRCVRFAVRADPPCCRFDNEHQSTLQRYSKLRRVSVLATNFAIR